MVCYGIFWSGQFTYHKWRVTLLLDRSVSCYRRPLKIRDFVWEIKYWDLRTLNNVKSKFSSFGVCLSFYRFFWLYCITTVAPFIRRSQGQGHFDLLAEIQVCCKFFQLQPKRETSFSSLTDQLEKSFIISPSNWTICAGLRGTSGFRPVSVTAVALTNQFAVWQLALTRRVQGRKWHVY